jgi:hypothetical protein
MKKVYCIAIITTLLFGCKAIIGIKDPKHKTNSEIQAAASKFGIPVEDLYILDSLYLDNELKTGKGEVVPVKNLVQPLQIRIYDKTGKLVGFQANCHSGGFPNLKWNGYNQLSSLPPQQSFADTVLAFDQDIKNFKTLINGQELNADKYKGNDFTFIVFWTVWMGRQTKVFLNEVNSYKSRHPDKKIGMVYVNAENLYLRKR